ncbi:MAG TPA: hypothetical protein ENJ95_03550 [Bacteroidetes bacterium]|nr:hypothetical protein [Bacteroidota bacterium]
MKEFTITYPKTVSLYLGREKNGNVVAVIDGNLIEAKYSLMIENHSPTGFNYGYSGSGPAQLALACCLHLFPQLLARLVYQKFKEDYIAPLDQYAQEITCEINISEFVKKHTETFEMWQDDFLHPTLI